MEFKDKWALILGGSTGLGFGTAEKLAKHGMNLCIVHRDRKGDLETIEKKFEKLRAHGVIVKSFNISALLEDTRSEVLKHLPDSGVHLLLHSVAKGSLKPLGGEEENSLSKTDIDITLHAMGTSWYEWTQALISQNKFSDEARNVAFTSAGNSRIWPGYAAVSAAKSVLESLMRSMAVELAHHGISTNCIQAGVTQTPSFEMIPGSEKLAELARKKNPFRRLTQPEDVANVVYLLCKEESKWINGTVIIADGGENLR